MMPFRIGYGEDIHRLVAGRRLIICGIQIPYEKGLKGHSDADVAIHALSDALLGSLALGDIGKLFPDTDPSTEGIDSGKILKKCLNLVHEKGYHPANVDLMIVAEAPKLAPYIGQMRANLASLLGCEEEDVSIKACTNEGLGPIGEGKAIKAIAVALVEKDI